MSYYLGAIETVKFNNTEKAYKYKSTAGLKKAYRLYKLLNLHWLSKPGQILLKFAIESKLPVKSIVKRSLFSQFCGGETLEECTALIEKLGQFRMNSILDYSVEGKSAGKGVEAAMTELSRTIEYASENTNVPYAVFKPTGIVSPELLEKAGKNQLQTDEDKAAFEDARGRFRTLCKLAYEKDIPIFIDAEESWVQDAIDALSLEMMLEFNKEKSIVQNTYQMYRHDRLEMLQKHHDKITAAGCKFGAKLVRGAYLEKENALAKKEGRPSPIHATKADTDRSFNLGVTFCIENLGNMKLCCATHNELSNLLLARQMAEKELPNDHPDIWFSQLYGMCDHISFNLSDAGYNVAKYIPYGPVEAVIPYLIRRAEENSSVTGQAATELKLLKKELSRRKG